MKSICLIILVGLLLTACLPPTPLAPTETITASPSVTPEPTATSTIIWFPPTATFTPFSTRQVAPTQEMRPGVGALIASDDFSDQSQWQVQRSETGSIAYGRGELTLAVAQSRGALFSLRAAPVLTDFFLEIEAYPSLCRSGDAYGLVLRASTPYDYYRLLINCQGQLRMERVKDGKSLQLHDWEESGQIQPGGLLKQRLSVWALGSELRVFVNGIHQFSVRDPVWSSGQVGLFARAGGDTPLTVNFSNLTIRSIDPLKVPTPVPSVTPTVKPSATRRPTATNAP